ncbi:MAG: type II secretion system protein [Epsilonproteobacteria bacterium]|nr:hypothetical protein [Campylobacterota bacterium]NPA56405.1 type II secretion system protein [Campylobacterota bacterium]
MRRGFTLVELAIVLVIVGFLIAMGVKGTELIKSAQLQKEAYKFKKISAAIGTAYNKFGGIPGDGWYGKYSQEAGKYVRTPRDGVIQFWESGTVRWRLVHQGLLDNEDLKILETPWFFSSSGWVGIDKEDGTDWKTVYYFDPGKVWNGGDVVESMDFGSGPFTSLVLAQYDNTRVEVKEDTREEGDEDGTCDRDCSDGLCDMNNDGDCVDTFTYYQPTSVRNGPADQNAYRLDLKVDNGYSWYYGDMRTALRYDMENDKYYRLNDELADSDEDKRPEVIAAKMTYGDNTRNRNFVAYKIW